MKVDQLKGNYEKEQGQLKPPITIPNFEQAQRIRFIRQARVVSEPEIYQESIVVSVRHVNLGSIRRSFPRASMMNAVYDWVGSLSDFLVFLELSAKLGTTIFPYMPIADNNTVLLMKESDRPLLFEIDAEISMPGFFYCKRPSCVI